MHAMHKALISLVTIAATANLGLAAGDNEPNLVQNGQMEITAPTGWDINKPDDASGTLTSVDEPTKSGQRALLLKGTGAWMSANSRQVPVNPKTKYLAACWIRTGKGHARVQYDHFENGQWLGSHSDGVRAVKDEWTLVTLESALDKYPNTTHVSLGIVSDGPEVEVYVDDVSLTTPKQQ